MLQSIWVEKVLLNVMFENKTEGLTQQFCQNIMILLQASPTRVSLLWWAPLQKGELRSCRKMSTWDLQKYELVRE